MQPSSRSGVEDGRRRRFQIRPVARGLTVLALPFLGCERGVSGDAPSLMAPAPMVPASAEVPVLSSPRVSLSGAGRAERPRANPTETRVFSRARRTWIYAAPNNGAEKLGYLRAGAGAETTSSEPAGKDGCPGGWYAVAPRGFVCVGAAATLDEQDPVVQLTRPNQPQLDRKLPYIYGTVRRPGPVYDRLPDEAHLARSEPDLERRMRAWLSAPAEIGAGYAQHVWLGQPGEPPDPARALQERLTEGVPQVFASGQPLAAFAEGDDAVAYRMRPRAGYSFLRTFFWQGRRYGLTTDLTIAPTDRFRPIQGSDFRGVELGREMDLPFAFVRHPAARFYVYQRSTDSIVDAGRAAYRAAVPLTGKQNFFRGRLHFETKDGKWISDRHASRIDPAKRMPAWGTNGERWLDVNLTRQTLVAYEGTRPVYATLISSGEAGLEDHEHSTATKRGIFRIHTKHVSSTMSSNEAGEAFELRDVPYVQYFDQGYALHGAYWHDRFGTPKSHGCINLAPEDARRLFFFTEPALPDNWHGVLLPLRGTVIFVHP